MEYFDSKYLKANRLSQNSHDMIRFRLQDLVKRYNITSYPLNCFQLLKDIIASNTIQLGFALLDEYPDNVDASAVYDAKSEHYFIMFNPKKIASFEFSPNRRSNFTMAHELGHIFLGHLLIPDDLKSDTDRIYEDAEADEFASRLLMPKSLLFQCNFIEKLTDQFLVTSQAFYTRVNNLKRLDLFKNKPVPTCKTCGNTHYSLCSRYCKICGTEVNRSTTRGIMRILYTKFVSGTNTCPFGHQNEFNARYCELCGQPTVSRNLLPEWQVERKKFVKSLIRLEHRAKNISTH